MNPELFAPYVALEAPTEAHREPGLVGPVMPPPPDFLEAAVERGLAVVLAEEALATLDDDVASSLGEAEAIDDEETVQEPDDRDSGVFELLDDGPPTLRFVRTW